MRSVDSSITIERLLNKHHHTTHQRTPDEHFNAIKILANKLGISHKKMGKVIQIAGTNGKGSTQHILWQLLQSAGKTCHVYTSPHLVHIHERVRLNDQLIDDEQLLQALVAVDALSDTPIGYFSLLTLAALWLFCQTPADYVLLETGVGGQYDPTNILDDHTMALITPIAKDHCHMLGNSLAEIATAKAYIQRPNRPCLSAPQSEAAAQTLKAISQDIRSSLTVITAKHYVSALHGAHQHTNISLAVAALKLLEPGAIDNIDNVLHTLHFPGRLHAITAGCIAAALKHDLWVDGAHNPAGAESLKAFIQDQQLPVYLWCAFKKNKDIAEFLAVLSPYCQAVIIQARDSNEFITEADGSSLSTLQCASSIDHAIEQLNRLPKGLVIACGSLHWVGDILQSAQ